MEKYLQKLLETQHLVIKLIKRNDQSFWQVRPQTNKWSAHEHFAHLVCYQHVFYNRMLLILETDNPHFERYEGNDDDAFILFKQMTIKELWQDFKKTRKKLTNLVAELSNKEVKRIATHSRYGELDMEQWFTFFILHESNHIFTIFQLQKQHQTLNSGELSAINLDNNVGSNLATNTINISANSQFLQANKQEFIEVYNSHNQPTGEILPRTEIHQKGLWHRTMHCWIIYKDKKGVDYVVFQRRSAWKDSDPNKFDTTAAGHYTADLPIEAQKFREIEEELGLQPVESELFFAGVRINVEDFQEQFFNHEFQDIYFWKNNTALKNYKLQTEEVSGLIALEITKGLELFTHEIATTTARGIEVIYAEDGTTSYKNKTFTIRKDDFGQTLDNYFAKALIMAKRILAGEKYVLI